MEQATETTQWTPRPQDDPKAVKEAQRQAWIAKQKVAAAQTAAKAAERARVAKQAT